jgi:hypothetical protein
MKEAPTSSDNGEDKNAKFRKPTKKRRPGKGPKYGDQEFKKRDPERELEPTELHLLCAEWARSRSVSQAADQVGITPARAYKAIMAFAKEHPDILENPDLLLWAELEMWDLAALAVQQAKANMKDIYGKNAVMTAWIARQKAEAYHKAWKEQMGAAATEDPDKLKAKLEAVQNELNQFDGSETAPGQGAATGTTSAGETEGSVADDANAGQGPAGGAD